MNTLKENMSNAKYLKKLKNKVRTTARKVLDSELDFYSSPSWMGHMKNYNRAEDMLWAMNEWAENKIKQKMYTDMYESASSFQVHNATNGQLTKISRMLHPERRQAYNVDSYEIDDDLKRAVRARVGQVRSMRENLLADYDYDDRVIEARELEKKRRDAFSKALKNLDNYYTLHRAASGAGTGLSASIVENRLLEENRMAEEDRMAEAMLDEMDVQDRLEEDMRAVAMLDEMDRIKTEFNESRRRVASLLGVINSLQRR